MSGAKAIRGQGVAWTPGTSGGSVLASITEGVGDTDQTIADTSGDAQITLSGVDTDPMGFLTAPGDLTVPSAAGNGLYRFTVRGLVDNCAPTDPSAGYIEVYFAPFVSGSPVDGKESGRTLPFSDGVLAASARDNVLMTADYRMEVGDHMEIWCQNTTDATCRVNKNVGGTPFWRFTVEKLSE